MTTDRWLAIVGILVTILLGYWPLYDARGRGDKMMPEARRQELAFLHGLKAAPLFEEMTIQINDMLEQFDPPPKPFVRRAAFAIIFASVGAGLALLVNR